MLRIVKIFYFKISALFFGISENPNNSLGGCICRRFDFVAYEDNEDYIFVLLALFRLHFHVIFHEFFFLLYIHDSFLCFIFFFAFDYDIFFNCLF